MSLRPLKGFKPVERGVPYLSLLTASTGRAVLRRPAGRLQNSSAPLRSSLRNRLSGVSLYPGEGLTFMSDQPSYIPPPPGICTGCCTSVNQSRIFIFIGFRPNIMSVISDNVYPRSIAF